MALFNYISIINLRIYIILNNNIRIGFPYKDAIDNAWGSNNLKVEFIKRKKKLFCYWKL